MGMLRGIGNVREALDDLVLMGDFAALIAGVLLGTEKYVSYSCDVERTGRLTYASTCSEEQSSLQVTWAC